MSIEICVGCATTVDLDYNCEDMRYIEDIGALCIPCYEATIEERIPSQWDKYEYMENMGYNDEQH